MKYWSAIAPLVAVRRETATLIVSAADVGYRRRIKVVAVQLPKQVQLFPSRRTTPGLEVPLIPEDMINKRSDGQMPALPLSIKIQPYGSFSRNDYEDLALS